MTDDSRPTKRVLDFGRVSREIRSLVSRRRNLILFLGSVFAAMGIYLQNVLEGKLPAALARLERNAFATYSLALLVPSVIVALRIAKLHAGMIINGVFYARILKEQHRPSMDAARSTRLNWLGVSAQLFLLASVIASLATALLMLALGMDGLMAAGYAIVTFALLLFLFDRFHGQAAKFAVDYIQTAQVEPVSGEEIEDHLSGSLEDANHDMITTIAFVGLMLFSVFESLSGLGGMRRGAEFASDDVQRLGPLVYSLLITLTSLLGIVVYLRLVISVGRFSLELDPTDRPFRPFKLTDSFLGYCLLVFFLVTSNHLLEVPVLDTVPAALWTVDAVVLALGLVAYPATLIVAGRRQGTGVK